MEDVFAPYCDPLEPCPFCKGEARTSYNGSLRYIICSKCGARGEVVDFKDYPKLNNIECYQLAADKWNNRGTNEFIKHESRANCNIC